MSGLRKFVFSLVMTLVAAPLWAVELVMVEEEGCVWCLRWDHEISAIYPKTDEGKFAPLHRVDIDDVPADIIVLRPVVFTPTFLVVENGHELARIEGYPGEDWFWPILAKLLTENTDFAGERG